MCNFLPHFGKLVIIHISRFRLRYLW